MSSTWTGALSILLFAAATGSALAQPADKQAPVPDPGQVSPQDPYAPAGTDPVMSEQIAEHLVTRAQELLEAKIYVDAKQLAVEAVVESPKGVAAERARYIIKQVNQVLGIKDDPVAMPDATKQPDLTPIEDPTKRITKSAEPGPVEPGADNRKPAAMVHGALYGGMLGASIGSLFDVDHPFKAGVPVGIAGGVAAGLLAPRIVDRLHWDEAQVRTAGSGALWGGVIGGMFAGVVTGANDAHATGADVMGGMGIGATIGLAGGAYYAHQHELTRGDVALVDTLAGMGTAGGLTMGMLMQPAQPEAYALNAALGAAAGVVTGLVAAPQTNTTQARMLRVAGLSAAGGAVPFVLLAAGPSKSGVQRAVGGLSTLGMLGGAWLGFYLTRNFEVGLDVRDGANPKNDAPPAVVGRDSDGHWHFGGVGMMGLSSDLATDQHGMSFTLFSGKLK